MVFATTRVDPRDHQLSEVSQAEKHKYQMISLIGGILKKKRGTNDLIYKSEIDRHRKQTMVTKRERGEG